MACNLLHYGIGYYALQYAVIFGIGTNHEYGTYQSNSQKLKHQKRFQADRRKNLF